MPHCLCGDRGSIPRTSVVEKMLSKKAWTYSSVWSERCIPNAIVAGSNPVGSLFVARYNQWRIKRSFLPVIKFIFDVAVCSSYSNLPPASCSRYFVYDFVVNLT